MGNKIYPYKAVSQKIYTVITELKNDKIWIELQWETCDKGKGFHTWNHYQSINKKTRGNHGETIDIRNINYLQEKLAQIRNLPDNTINKESAILLISEIINNQLSINRKVADLLTINS